MNRFKQTATPDWLESVWRDDSFCCEQFRVDCGMAFAKALIGEYRIDEALIIFSELTVLSPESADSAIAWYWLALEAHVAGDISFRNECAQQIKNILQNKIHVHDEWKLQIKAELISRGLGQKKTGAELAGYGEGLINKIRSEIESDLSRMSARLWTSAI